ncbi:MAG: UDP-2,4-diacetamido-2,4,6-trideoxy-beta-L-altropyranose hydrolase [Anaerolineae bacterium]|nr:UDP-2,4-diacetamido-2,4,6-trideoxy-beta-L-altropyranose hydrolase [Anaerolineae bacterium]NUQ06270.1 UDP-2,4-diacetamido-2,4,6-trideoxy-beta-L-altropyranose hydrolase [Anaerolineae bacterium]
MPSLVIRADASASIGTGHVLRCLALAQAWRDRGGSVTFFTHTAIPASMEQRLRDEGMQVVRHEFAPGSTEDGAVLCTLAEKNSVVVVDGYVFGADYQRQIKNAGLPLLFLDDNGHVDHYHADWVLNQNVHAQESLYTNREAYTRLLLGTRYVLLRREFWRWRGWKRHTTTSNHLLITMGGSDSDNVTYKAIRAIRDLQLQTSMTVTAVIGNGNPHLNMLRTYVHAHRLPVEFLFGVTDMPALMAKSDMALSAGGSTLWELALLQVPTIAVVTADNQKDGVETLEAAQAVVSLGWHESVEQETIARQIEHLRQDFQQRASLVDAARALVDGEGVERVIAQIRGCPIRLRSVTEADSKLVWEWANDPTARQYAFNPAPIPWENHVRWFEKQLASDTAFIFIAFDADENPVGQIRFEFDESKRAKISYSIDPERRGAGLGTWLLQEGTDRLFRSTSAAAAYGLVMNENIASRRAFEKANFMLAAGEFVNETNSLCYQRLRE